MAKIIYVGENGCHLDSLFSMLRERGHQVAVSMWDYSIALQDLGVKPVFPDGHKVTPPGPPYDMIILEMLGMPVGLEYMPTGLLESASVWNPGLVLLRLLRQGNIPELAWAKNIPVFVTDASACCIPVHDVLKVSPQATFFPKFDDQGWVPQIQSILCGGES
ncbi:MAG: hypothetical protein NTU97_01590 [Candidatus Magasanikbacteria bacterium]|nr:hypothetical protein [Candidatus Magasanikbacteria bacterium]